MRVNMKARQITKRFMRQWPLYVMLLLPVGFIILFNYVPMYGTILAFKDFQIRKGIMNSPWAAQYGFENFIRFFNNYNFIPTLRNTVILSVYTILLGFPCTIILALSLNYVRKMPFRKTVQMISYFPYFISVIVLAGMVSMIFNSRTGVMGRLYFSLTSGNILSEANMFPHLYVWSGLWQTIGFSAIIYIAALSNVDPQLHEAALIDGATVFHRIWHIDLPTIIPTVTILLILNMGSILSVGYEKVLAMQNQNNISMSEVISTYSYKISLASSIPDFSYGTAIGLFQSLIGLILILVSNKVVNKMTGNGFW